MKKNIFFSEGGQASAPFELMVAVIIMSFVMVVGYMVLDTVNTQVCLNSVDREMTEFKLALEDSVARMSSTPLVFRPEGTCFNSKKAHLKIYVEENRSRCSSICGFAANSCFVMYFDIDEMMGSTKVKCLNLPAFTSFQEEPTCVDSVLQGQGYSTIDPTIEGKFLPGSYIIRNISPAGHPFPMICVWYKTV